MKRHVAKKTSNKRKILYSILTIIVIGALFIGFSRAWFYNQMDMETLMEVKPPAGISILGPGGSEMTSLELNSANAEKDENGKLTIRRVICVQSDSDYYKLEIVHTTNLKGIEFKLYGATMNDSGNITDGGYSYQYDSSHPIEGEYVNRGDGGTTEYKSADKTTKYNENFSDTDKDKVQLHAEPLYWKPREVQKANAEDDVIINNKLNHRTYYVCEVSWTETTKETDVFYVLAETANGTQ